MKQLFFLLAFLLTFSLFGQDSGIDTTVYPDGSFDIINFESLENIYPDGVPKFGLIYLEKERINSAGFITSQRTYLGDKIFLFRQWDDFGGLEYLLLEKMYEGGMIELAWTKRGVDGESLLTYNKIYPSIQGAEIRFRETDGFVEMIKLNTSCTPGCGAMELTGAMENGTYWVRNPVMARDFLPQTAFEIHLGDTQRELSWGSSITLLFDVYESVSAYEKGTSELAKKYKHYKTGGWNAIDKDGKLTIEPYAECPSNFNVTN